MPRKLTKIISNAKQKIGFSSKKHSAGFAGGGGGVGDEDSYASNQSGSSKDLTDGVGGGCAEYDSSTTNRRHSSRDNLLPSEQLSANSEPSAPVHADHIDQSHQPDPESNCEGSKIRSTSISNGFRRLFTNISRPQQPLTAASGYNELFAEQNDLQQKSWWQTNFMIDGVKPALFGTWNGVFVTSVVHLFGVISFLRLGWIVGHEGVLVTATVAFGCFLFTTIALLAAIGIMERCAAATSVHCWPQYHGHHHRYLSPEYPTTVASARANVHLLISTVLGSRIGGAISLVYCFGQAVSCALHVTGFTETFVQVCALFIKRHLTIVEQSVQQNSQLYHHYGHHQQHRAQQHLLHHRASGDQLASSIANNSSISKNLFARTMARLLLIDIKVVQSDSQPPLLPRSDTFELTLTPYTYQLVSAVVILVLFVFNIIGVRCLFRLQTILFITLLLAVLDFTVGLFETHPDQGYGTIEASAVRLKDNLYPNLLPSADMAGFWRKLFETVGVFFPATIGVMAGVNMGSDLETPTRSIPVGSLSAIVSSYALHLLFIVGLGLTCTRVALLNDYAISQHVSALGLFFLFGLYMSAVSSSLGSMYTAPRIMQNLAQELHTLPVVRCFAFVHGPNKIPTNALILFTLVTLGFVMLGGINVLAPIVTIPYLLTYATIEYAYFSMAMTFDIQIQREKRFMTIATQLRDESPRPSDTAPDGSTNDETKQGSNKTSKGNGKNDTGGGSVVDRSDTISLTPSLGVGGTVGYPPPPSPTPSMQQHLAGYGSVQSITQHIKIKRRQSTQSSSSGSGDSDPDWSIPTPKKSVSKSAGKQETKQQQPTKESKPKTIRQLMAAVSDDDDDDEEEQVDVENAKQEQNSEVMSNLTGSKAVKSDYGDEDENDDDDDEDEEEELVLMGRENSVFRFDATVNSGDKPNITTNDPTERLLNPDPEMAEIGCKQETWYLRLVNRWIVLLAAIIKVALMFSIAWHYALVTVVIFVALYLIIGRTNPGFYPGVSEFILYHWIEKFVRKIFRGLQWSKKMDSGTGNLVASYSYDRIVLPPSSIPNLNYQSDQLTKENSDYSARQPFHHSTTINPQFGED